VTRHALFLMFHSAGADDISPWPWAISDSAALTGASLLGFLQVSDFLYGLPCSNAKM
jgi:hypothetical protein